MKKDLIHVLNIYGNAELSATISYITEYIREYNLPIKIADISYDKGIFIFKSHEGKLRVENTSWSEKNKTKKEYTFSELPKFAKQLREYCKCKFKDIEFGEYFKKLNTYGNPDSGMLQKIGFGKMYSNSDGYIDISFHKFNSLDDSTIVLKQKKI